MLINHTNNLAYVRAKGFSKLKEQFNCEISPQDSKSFVFVFGEKQIEPAQEDLTFEVLVERNILSLRGQNSDDSKLQLDFRVKCCNLDIEANLMRETVVKKEHESYDFATLVRTLDENGNPHNCTATLAKHRQCN